MLYEHECISFCVVCVTISLLYTEEWDCWVVWKLCV